MSSSSSSSSSGSGLKHRALMSNDSPASWLFQSITYVTGEKGLKKRGLEVSFRK